MTILPYRVIRNEPGKFSGSCAPYAHFDCQRAASIIVFNTRRAAKQALKANAPENKKTPGVRHVPAFIVAPQTTSDNLYTQVVTNIDK